MQVDAGAVVIDKYKPTLEWTPDIPFSVPEVNPQDIKAWREKGHYCKSKLFNNSDGSCSKASI